MLDVTQNTPVLEIEKLCMSYGNVQALYDVDLSILKGQTMGIVGESGSGKSTLSRAILRLLPDSASVTHGSLRCLGQDIYELSAEEMREFRGERIAYISQDPLRALTPTLSIAQQMTDIQFRSGRSMQDKRSYALEMLERVGMPQARRRLDMFPHELSGGQRQRVSIAMGVMMRPELLIADEITTALDATLEVEILDLLKDLQCEIGMAMVFVTHHLGTVPGLCDNVAVMKAGRVVECGKTEQVFSSPEHIYTKTLLRCDPANVEAKTRVLPTVSDPIDQPLVIETGSPDRVRLDEAPILEVSDLNVTFHRKAPFGGLFGGRDLVVQAVKNASLKIHKGETVAIVGESGSGKTTFARTITGMLISAEK